MSPEPNLADATTYANCMNEVRQRLGVVKWLVTGNRLVNSEFFFTTELIFLQLRKTLELIAFGSLTAHREEYVAAYANASSHWRAKAILDSVEKLNPDFYPLALVDQVAEAEGIKRLTPMADGFMTKAEFAQLYDVCGEILHARNPFSEKELTTQIGYSVDEWIGRIQRLLAFHSIIIASGDRWLVVIPSEGDVHVYPAGRREASVGTTSAPYRRDDSVG